MEHKTQSTGPKRSKPERERDLLIVAEMYLQSYPQYKIADMLNNREGIGYQLTYHTISDDIAEIQKRWIKAQVSIVEQVKIEQLKKIDLVEHQAWLGWERSLMIVSRTETKAVKNQNKEAPLVPTGYVYVMYNSANNKHKIGHSKTPAKREKTLQSTEPDITMLFYFEGSRRDEGNLQKMFESKRVRGEWFEGLDENDMEKIAAYIEDLNVARIEHGQVEAQSDNTPDKIERKVFEATGEGNATFLNTMLRCVEMRSKLFGLMSTKLDITSKGNAINSSVLVLPDNNRAKPEAYDDAELSKMMLLAKGEANTDE